MENTQVSDEFRPSHNNIYTMEYTQQSDITSSTRKKYYVKRNKIKQQIGTNIKSQSNIFDLTAGLNINSSYSYSQIEIGSNSNSLAASKLYTNSLVSQASKASFFNENPQIKIVLPIITQSKYNFKPKISFPKVKLNLCHEKAPLYLQNAQKIDKSNIRKMKKYKKMWSDKQMLRSDKSILDRSVQKAQKYIQKHNADYLNRKKSMDFQNILRDRHIKQANRIGQKKGVPNRSLPGLRGKGGSVRSLFQEMYCVEEVYKIDK